MKEQAQVGEFRRQVQAMSYETRMSSVNRLSFGVNMQFSYFSLMTAFDLRKKIILRELHFNLIHIDNVTIIVSVILQE